jgi:predicted phosphodiesterase
MDAPLALAGPSLFFGGPCSNLESIRALLAEAARRRVPAERIICTGDVVAYGADAQATVDLVRESGIRVVRGNCEEALATGAADCGCGFAPGSACDRLSLAWFAHAERELDSDARTWMGVLPRRLDVEIAGLTLAVVHGSFSETNRFVFASTPDRVKALDLARSGRDGIVAGHCGLPFTQIIQGRLWHNPGVIGVPANDGTPRVWFSILAPGPEPRTLVVEHHALSYDHGSAAAKMRAAGLPDDYADTLACGVWPSCDVLPPREAKAQGVRLRPGALTWRRDEAQPRAAEHRGWPFETAGTAPHLDPGKFRNPVLTATGERRAWVALKRLKTLWINTGTLCNLACENCYIESTPRNDRLVYITAAEVRTYLDEIEDDGLPTELIGFTGGEPFMNRDLLPMLEDVLARGLKALVLTNAMRPMRRHERGLLGLRRHYGASLRLRVSIDHYTRALHELERGPRSWQPTLEGLRWLAANGFAVDVAGRLFSGEAEPLVRAGYGRLFEAEGIHLDSSDPARLVLFPEMDATADVPEITEACWSVIGRSPGAVMCSSARMVVKRKGADRPAVLACTLLPYDVRFELGATLREASRSVSLNHPHCAKFCVLGGGACSAG